MMSNFFIISVLIVLFTSITCRQISEKQRNGRSVPRCKLPPDRKYGTWIKTNDNYSHFKYQLKCEKGYYSTLSENNSIECYEGHWPNTIPHCEEKYSTILYKNLLYILPAVGVVIVIIIVVTCLVLRNKRKSEAPVPKWKKNEEERIKKFSVEEQEKVYKDLIETSRLSFRFPFFFPKGRPTGKKPILVEEGGYLVPNRRRRNCNLTKATNQLDRTNHTNNSDLSAVSAEGEIKTAVKHEDVARELIKELQHKQAACKISTKAKVETVNKPATKPLYSNLTGGFFGVCKGVEDNPKKLRSNHRDDVAFNEAEEEYLSERHEDGSTNQLDPSKICTASSSCSRMELRQAITVQPNQIVRHKEPAYIKNNELENKHQYCNIISAENIDVIPEETSDEATASPVHVYANLHLK